MNKKLLAIILVIVCIFNSGQVEAASKKNVKLKSFSYSKIFYGEETSNLNYSFKFTNSNGSTIKGKFKLYLDKTMSNAGTYKVKYKFVPSSKKYNTKTGTVEIAISKKPVYIYLKDSYSKEFGEVDPDFLYTYKGTIGNDKVTGALNRRKGEEVGTYRYVASNLEYSDNYQLYLEYDKGFEIVEANH